MGTAATYPRGTTYLRGYGGEGRIQGWLTLRVVVTRKVKRKNKRRKKSKENKGDGASPIMLKTVFWQGRRAIPGWCKYSYLIFHIPHSTTHPTFQRTAIAKKECPGFLRREPSAKDRWIHETRIGPPHPSDQCTPSGILTRFPRCTWCAVTQVPDGPAHNGHSTVDVRSCPPALLPSLCMVIKSASSGQRRGRASSAYPTDLGWRRGRETVGSCDWQAGPLSPFQARIRSIWSYFARHDRLRKPFVIKENPLLGR